MLLAKLKNPSPITNEFCDQIMLVKMSMFEIILKLKRKYVDHLRATQVVFRKFSLARDGVVTKLPFFRWLFQVPKPMSTRNN